MQSVVTRQVPISLERKITSGGKQIKQEIGSVILGVKNNPHLQMMWCMSLESKTHEHTGLWWNQYVFMAFGSLFFSHWILLQLGWNILENGSRWQAVLLYVRSADENVGGSVVDIFWKLEVIGKLYYVRPADENMGGSVVDIFRKTQDIGKLYCVRSANETRVIRWVFFGLRDSIDSLLWVMEAGRPSWTDLING